MLRSKCEIFFLEGEHGDVRHVVATITKENIRGGSEVTDSNRKDLKNHQSGDEEGTVHAGHLVAFVLGGKGGKNVHNVVNMAAALNQGPYKEAERQLLNCFHAHPNATVDIDIEMNVGVDGIVHFQNPVNFRYKWMNRDTTALYDSGVLTNTNTFVRQEYTEKQRALAGFHKRRKQVPLPSFSMHRVTETVTATETVRTISKVDSLNRPLQDIDPTLIAKRSTEYNPVP